MLQKEKLVNSKTIRFTVLNKEVSSAGANLVQMVHIKFNSKSWRNLKLTNQILVIYKLVVISQDCIKMDKKILRIPVTKYVRPPKLPLRKPSLQCFPLPRVLHGFNEQFGILIPALQTKLQP